MALYLIAWCWRRACDLVNSKPNKQPLSYPVVPGMQFIRFSAIPSWRKYSGGQRQSLATNSLTLQLFGCQRQVLTTNSLRPLFSFAQELRSAGVKVVWGSPADVGSTAEGSFDTVIDNNGKDLESVQ